MNKWNKTGSSTDPWGIPLATAFQIGSAIVFSNKSGLREAQDSEARREV